MKNYLILLLITLSVNFFVANLALSLEANQRGEAVAQGEISASEKGVIKSKKPIGNKTAKAVDELPEYTEPILPITPGSTILGILKLVVSLVVIIILIYVVLFLIKKGMSSRQMLATSGQAFNVLSQLHLSPKKSLCMVEIPGRIFILGITDGNINLLTEISDQESMELIRDSIYKPESMPSSFLRQFKRLLSREKESVEQDTVLRVSDFEMSDGSQGE